MMGHTVMNNMRENYGPRPGLEGPFNFSGQVLYYDPIEGAYWDPKTDFYVSQAEMDGINARLMNTLRG
jgi:hypothetical protein